MKRLVLFALILAVILISGCAAKEEAELGKFVKNQTERVREAEEAKIRCSAANLTIDNIRYNCDSGKISLDAYNSGTIKLENFRFVIILTNQTTYTLRANNDTISPGEKRAFYNSTYNLFLTSPSQIDKLIFISDMCPLSARDTVEGSKIIGDNC